MGVQVQARDIALLHIATTLKCLFTLGSSFKFKLELPFLLFHFSLEPRLFFFALSTFLLNLLVVVFEPLGVSLPILGLVGAFLLHLVVVAYDEAAYPSVFHADARDELLLRESIHRSRLLKVLTLQSIVFILLPTHVFKFELAQLGQ